MNKILLETFKETAVVVMSLSVLTLFVLMLISLYLGKNEAYNGAFIFGIAFGLTIPMSFKILRNWWSSLVD